MKKVPERTCIACRSAKPKNELLRVVRDPEGAISLDFTGKKNGRGAYICKDKACLAKCVKSKALDRALNCKVDSEVYERLLKEYDENSGN